MPTFASERLGIGSARAGKEESGLARVSCGGREGDGLFSGRGNNT